MAYARTALLLAGLTALFLVTGYALGGRGGMVVALLAALATNAFAYWNADKMVLSMAGAYAVSQADAPVLYDIVADLARRAQLPMPRLYIIDTPQPNAFATGRGPEHAAVAASAGLLDTMTREQVAGVIAHELAHVKNRDILVMTIAATLAGAVGMVAQFGLFFGGRDNEEGRGPGLVGGILAMILAPLAASLVQMAISRTREYGADRLGAEISGHPLWLASALERLEDAAAIPNDAAERHPATAHMFIVNPLTGGGLQQLFSTHPSIHDRVARLRAMSGQPPAGTPQPGPWG